MMLSTGARVDSRTLSAALKRRVDGFWIGTGRICSRTDIRHSALGKNSLTSMMHLK